MEILRHTPGIYARWLPPNGWHVRYSLVKSWQVEATVPSAGSAKSVTIQIKFGEVI